MASWFQNGVSGLQSVVLYSLPELDGAIDAIPLGGLVRDDIYLCEERLIRLSSRMKSWHNLRQKGNEHKKVAVTLYGFPPNVGAIGTAALMNVPESLERMLVRLHEEGYHIPAGVIENVRDAASPLDDVPAGDRFGERVVKALTRMLDAGVVYDGTQRIKEEGAKIPLPEGVELVAETVTVSTIRSWLNFPEEWGPSEWGPLPILPRSSFLYDAFIKQWGNAAGGLESVLGLGTNAKGESIVCGIKVGNVFICVQPVLGLEGDPMRLLFERDLTPHAQYIAQYLWLQQSYRADGTNEQQR